MPRTVVEHANVLRKAALEAKLNSDEMLAAGLQLVSEEIVKTPDRLQKRLVSLLAARAIMEVGKMTIEEFYSKPSVDLDTFSTEDLAQMMLSFLTAKK